jgi:ABC-2 type transport system ATP-binding protein
MQNSPPVISVKNLAKTFKVTEREAGLGAALKSLVVRKTRDVNAVQNVSFDIAPGEIVGFIGPNGAGKTTTLKMLSGLIHPTTGEVKVLNHTPQKREPKFLRQMTLVMGQRNQLVWDIPVVDTFELNRAIYQIPDAVYKSTRRELDELLGLEPLLKKSARNLSLGERMKCEIAASLLHLPSVLFLDEPTIGLDVTMQRRIREFIGEYNRRNKACIILTSHYMSDVEYLCSRVLVIHQGTLLFDGNLSDLRSRFSSEKLIELRFKDGVLPDLTSYGRVGTTENGMVTISVSRDEAPARVSRLLEQYDILDLTVEDPPLEDVIHKIFSEGKA